MAVRQTLNFLIKTRSPRLTPTDALPSDKRRNPASQAPLGAGGPSAPAPALSRRSEGSVRRIALLRGKQSPNRVFLLKIEAVYQGPAVLIAVGSRNELAGGNSAPGQLRSSKIVRASGTGARRLLPIEHRPVVVARKALAGGQGEEQGARDQKRCLPAAAAGCASKILRGTILHGDLHFQHGFRPVRDAKPCPCKAAQHPQDVLAPSSKFKARAVTQRR